MKKRVKKLTLNRETLLSLDGFHLQQAEGGATGVLCTTYTNCCSGYNTCATCRVTCTTKYC